MAPLRQNESYHITRNVEAAQNDAHFVCDSDNGKATRAWAARGTFVLFMVIVGACLVFYNQQNKADIVVNATTRGKARHATAAEASEEESGAVNATSPNRHLHINYPDEETTYNWMLHKVNGSMCMDGSMGGIFVREPLKANRNWLILFTEGSSWCNVPSNCRPRGWGAPLHRWASSSKWGNYPVSVGKGILEPGSGMFSGWNVMALGSCDSSIYAGTRPRIKLVGGKPYLFHGQQNLMAYFQYWREALLSGEVETVVLLGQGMGGAAITLHLHTLEALIAPTRAKTFAAVANALIPSVPETAMGAEEHRRMTLAWEFWDPAPSVHPDCLAARIATNDTWKCLLTEVFGQYTAKVGIPLFIVQDPKDEGLVKSHGVAAGELVPEMVQAGQAYVMLRINAAVSVLQPQLRLDWESVTAVGDVWMTPLCYKRRVFFTGGARDGNTNVADPESPCALLRRWLESGGAQMGMWNSPAL